jgi:hypothetical protein
LIRTEEPRSEGIKEAKEQKLKGTIGAKEIMHKSTRKKEQCKGAKEQLCKEQKSNKNARSKGTK